MNWGGRVVCLPMTLVCSATWEGGSDYNLVPTLKTVPESNPGGGNIFLSCPDHTCGPFSLTYNGYQVFPRGKEQPGLQANPSLPSSDVVKKQ